MGFGEKASDVKDTSLRVKTGTTGTVIDVQVFTRDGVEKDARALEIEQMQLDEVRKDLNEEMRIVKGATFERLQRNLVGAVVNVAPDLKKGDVLTEEYLNALDTDKWFKIMPQDETLAEMLEAAEKGLEERRQMLDDKFEDKKRKLQTGDDLAAFFQTFLSGFQHLCQSLVLRHDLEPLIRIESIQILFGQDIAFLQVRCDVYYSTHQVTLQTLEGCAFNDTHLFVQIFADFVQLHLFDFQCTGIFLNAVTGKYLYVDNGTGCAGLNAQRGIFNVRCFLTEDRTQQFFFRRQLGFTLRCHLTNPH